MLESQEDYYYAHNDRYPLTLQECVRDSHTATAIARTKSNFVYGSGAANQDMGKMVVNPDTGMTLNDLLRNLSPDLVKQEQFYLWIKLNEFREQIYSLERTSPTNTRLGKPNRSNKIASCIYSPFAFGTRDYNSNLQINIQLSRISRTIHSIR